MLSFALSPGNPVLAARGSGGGGGGSYTAQAVHFDGATFLQSADALGAVNGPRGIFSVWCFQTAKSGLSSGGNIPMVVTEDGYSCWVTCPGGGGAPGGGDPTGYIFNGAGIVFYSEDGASDWENIDSADDICPVGQWFHVLISWDMGFVPGSRRSVVYVDGVQYPFPAPGQVDDEGGGAFDINYNNTRYYIGNFSVSSRSFAETMTTLMLGDLADMYLNTTDTIVEADLTISDANIQKFRTAGGKPVALGADGSTPTGTKPLFFLSGDHSSWASNAAGTGSFNVRRIINATSLGGAGAVTATGAVAGETVFVVFDEVSHSDVSSDFESVISINGQIQQTGTDDLSGHHIVVSLPGALTNATTSPSD